LFNKNASGSSQDNSPGYPGSNKNNTASTSMYSASSTPSRSKIRIMPMYGDPKSMVGKNADPQEKIVISLKYLTELQEENNRLLSAQGGKTDKTTQEIYRLHQNLEAKNT
jgi:hypothetical protein